MKIQIKPVYYSEFFPNRKKKLLFPIIRDYSVQPTTYSNRGVKYRVGITTRKDFAKKVSKKLSLPLEEVMVTYKDKIETAYWKNLDEYIKAMVTDSGIFGYKNHKDPELSSSKRQDDFNGFESEKMMIPSLISVEYADIYYSRNLYVKGNDWVYYHYKSSDDYWKDQYNPNHFDEKFSDFDYKGTAQFQTDLQNRMREIGSIDVLFYKLNGNVTKRKKIYLEEYK